MPVSSWPRAISISQQQFTKAATLNCQQTEKRRRPQASLARMSPAAALVITIRCDRECLLPAGIYKHGKSAAAGGLPVCWRSSCFVSSAGSAVSYASLLRNGCFSSLPRAVSHPSRSLNLNTWISEPGSQTITSSRYSRGTDKYFLSGFV